MTAKIAESTLGVVSAKRTVTLDIAGSKYKLSSDAEEEHLKLLSAMIEERIHALGPKAHRAASPAQLLAVVALGLADDLVSSDKRRRKVEDTTRRAIEAAISRIDRRLDADAELASKSISDGV